MSDGYEYMAFPAGKFQEQGMTLRDYFAGQALAGYMASENTDSTLATIAEWSYRAADAMLEAREKGVDDDRR